MLRERSYQSTIREYCYCNCDVFQDYKSLAKSDEIKISNDDRHSQPYTNARSSAILRADNIVGAGVASSGTTSSSSSSTSLRDASSHGEDVLMDTHTTDTTRGTTATTRKRVCMQTPDHQPRRTTSTLALRSTSSTFFADPPYGLLGTFCSYLCPREVCALEKTSKRLLHSIMVNEVWKSAGMEKFRNIGFNGVDQFLDPVVDKYEPPLLSERPPRLAYRCGDICCSWTIGAPMRRPTKKEINWKGRYKYFATHSLAFRPPDKHRITRTPRRDYVSYLQASLMNSIQGLYCEVLIEVNDDNLSLSVVDYDDGGQMSSITFSPDTGAVIKERKIHENPRMVQGTYAQCLSQTKCPFRGRIGLYVKDGWLAFYRKECRRDSIWQTTDFCTRIDASLTTDGRKSPPAGITPCLAFRDAGNYVCSVVKICRDPPFKPMVAENIRWQPLMWDAAQVRRNPRQR